MVNKIKCPYCDKEFNTTWQVTNHVRISAGDHGPKHSLPKDYKPPEPNVSTEGLGNDPNLSDPNVSNAQMHSNTNVTKIEPPEKPIIKDLTCPDCGAHKNQWIAITQAQDYGYNLTEDQLKEYQYICSECNEFIKVK